MLFPVFQEFSSKHRGECQGSKRRDDNRTGHHKTEFPEQASTGSFHEHNRDKYSGQCNGGRDDGKENFLGSFNTSLKRFHSPFDADVNIFRHDNGIIHNQSHGQDDSQHRKHVDGESCHVHHKECSNQGDRNHDTGDQCHAPVAQEEENDDDNQYKSFVYRTLYFRNGSTDKASIIETVGIFYVIRQVLLHLLHTFVYGICNINVVGTRLRDDYHTDHGHTVHLHVAFDVGRPQLGIPDVAEAYYLSILFL